MEDTTEPTGTSPAPLDLHNFDRIVINTSAGKDSQTAMRFVVLEADRQAFDRSRIVAVHADLGEMEWDNVPELARLQAEHYGLRFEVVKRRNKDGEEQTLLEYVKKRGKWPSAAARYCTSDFKRGPCQRLITKVGREVLVSQDKAKILSVFGFRAQESPARAKRPTFQLNERASTKSRSVYEWSPIHHWTEAEVWQDIHDSGVPYHEAYDLGMPRLSCVFCILAPEQALKIAGRAKPQLLNEYASVEIESGHTFRHDFSIAEMRDEILREQNT